MQALSFPISLSAGFVLLIILLFGWFMFRLEKYLESQNHKGKAALIIRIIISSYLALLLLGTYPEAGLPTDVFWKAASALSLGIVLYLPFNNSYRSFVSSISIAHLIWFQFFRVFQEVIFYLLAADGIIPAQMCFGGLQFDIHLGVAALFIGAMAATEAKPAKLAIQIWSVIGVISIFWNYYLFVGSAPGLFQVFNELPLNRLGNSVPFIWVPAFSWPVALLFHITIWQKIRGMTATKNRSLK